MKKLISILSLVMPQVRWRTCNVRHSSTVRQASKKRLNDWSGN